MPETNQIFTVKVPLAVAVDLSSSLQKLDPAFTPAAVKASVVVPGDGGVVVKGTNAESAVYQTTPVGAVRFFLQETPANFKMTIIAVDANASESGGETAPTGGTTTGSKYIEDVYKLVGSGGTILTAVAKNAPALLNGLPKDSFGTLRKLVAKLEKNPAKLEKRIGDFLDDDYLSGTKPGKAAAMCYAAPVKPRTTIDDNDVETSSFQFLLTTTLFQERKGDSDETKVQADLDKFHPDSDLYAWQKSHPDMTPRTSVQFRTFDGSAPVPWWQAFNGPYPGGTMMASVDWVVKGARMNPRHSRIGLSCFVNAVNVVAVIGKNGGGGGGAAGPSVNDEQKALMKRTFAMVAAGGGAGAEDHEAKRACVEAEA